MRLALVVLLCAAGVRADDEPTEFQRFFETHPKALPLIFGAQICYDRKVRSVALEEIAKEKKYGRIGGVENKVSLYARQQQIRWADEQLPEDIKNAKGWKAKPMPCSHAAVKAIVNCKITGQNCDDEIGQMAYFIETPDDE